MKIIPYDSINKTRRGMRVMSRELLYQRGSDSLSDTGLLEVIINTGATNNSVNQISKNINAVMQKYGIECVTAKDFLSIKGIGKARAAMLMASIEYFRRLYTKPTAPLIDTPEKAFEQLAHIKNKKQEHFVLLTLDGARRLISNRIVTIGTMMASLVHPREVFAYAIEDRAASIIVAHNHPSGMLDVSQGDTDVTNRLKQVADIVGVHLDDHLIVAGDEFVSAM